MQRLTIPIILTALRISLIPAGGALERLAGTQVRFLIRAAVSAILVAAVSGTRCGAGRTEPPPAGQRAHRAWRRRLEDLGVDVGQ